MVEARRPQVFVHGAKLRRKVESEASVELAKALEAYEDWSGRSLGVGGREQNDVSRLVDYLNEYKTIVEPLFDARPNSAQEVLQPSILEEFMEYLFVDVDSLVGRELVRRPERGYLSLVFNPKSLEALATAPDFTIYRKDHDFIIGASLLLVISDPHSGDQTAEEIVVPAVALECKRYLERNMLDECAGTALRVKRATPYCLYVVVSEYLKMDDAAPELSRIDEIYVLRRQRNSERLGKDFVPNPIAADLVWDLFVLVTTHLRRIWWDPQSALTRGKVFNFT